MSPLLPVTLDKAACGQRSIVVHGVVKRFGRGDNMVTALNGVELEARYGQMLMIVGPSGCGKTTLLSALCGTLSVESGYINVFGFEVTRMSQAALTRFRRDHVGFVFQQFNLVSTWTAAENVSVPLLLAGWSRREAMAAARKMLAEVGLGKRTHAFPSELSGGQQQRVAIARALVHDPKLVICDEPTAALDAATGLHVMELLSQIARREDRTVIVVTHDPRIFRFPDTVVELEDGKVKYICENEERQRV
ncbi:MAG: ABC transporter ATP-binding protein [Candidatus Sumerlaeaceae bacterium]|nr:ABC transporter ATP-binding protein [Candidatus Sumerlaeaceae bacterium]